MLQLDAYTNAIKSSFFHSFPSLICCMSDSCQGAQHQVFLVRNVPAVARKQKAAAPIPLAGVELENGLECKISCATSKVRQQKQSLQIVA